MSRATAGFRDVREITLRVEASMVVLNEVLAQPGAGFPEFIELFNLSEVPVDVEGWSITELAGENVVTHTVTGTPSAAADLVAYDDSLTTTVPALGHLALKFNGGSAYLNNTGDTITLFDGAGNQLDQYVYMTSLSGKSDARIPDGTGGWIDPVPTPGEANVLEEGIELPPALVSLSEVVLPVPADTPADSLTEPTVPPSPVLPPVEPEEIPHTDTEPTLLPEATAPVPSEDPAGPIQEVQGEGEALPEGEGGETTSDVPPLTAEEEEPADPPVAKTEEDEPDTAAETVTEPAV
jgi:hypothetical protein